MIKWFHVVFLSLMLVFNLYSQDDDSVKTEFLKHAPPRVKEYYHVFDSLGNGNPTWNNSVTKIWTDDEVKKYGSMVFEMNEYNPIAARKYESKLRQNAKSAGKNIVISQNNVINEIESRFPLKYKQLIKQSAWLKVIVTQTELFKLPELQRPNKYRSFNIIRVNINEVLKGNTFRPNGPVTFFYGYGWGYPPLEVGKEYIVALFAMPDNPTSEDFRFVLGAPMDIYKSVFPIEGNFVTDEENVMGLGKEVQLNTFLDAVKATISEIRSWKEEEK